MPSPTIPTLDDVTEMLRPVQSLVDERMSEIQKYRIALEKIRENSHDSWAVDVAEEALG